MHVQPEKIKEICRRNSLSLKVLLFKSAVSKTAFYALCKNENLLPKSLISIAKVLEVSPMVLLEEENAQEKLTERRIKKLNAILRKHPKADRGNVWHTLILLDQNPIDRLKRALVRGRKFNFHR